MKVRAEDGRVHYSNLKKMALSPAHYKASCETPFEPTRAMRVGTGTHFLVLGPRAGKLVLHCDVATRNAKEYKILAEKNPDADILTQSEWDDAVVCAHAVLTDPLAFSLLEKARKEVPLEWSDGGIECSTSGVDAVGDDYIVELKVTTNTEPLRWQKHAFRMGYHAQLGGFYSEGARQNGLEVRRHFVIGVEDTLPHAVTVLELTPELVTLGRKEVVLWLERLRGCEDSDFWPTYTQTPVKWDVPTWLGDDGDEVAA